MARLSIKVVPGARADRVVGRYGEAIRVQVSAPPQDGRANKAVVALLARALGIRANQVSIIRGRSQPRKIVEIEGIGQAEAESRLTQAASES